MTRLRRAVAVVALLALAGPAAALVPFSRADADRDGVISWPEARAVFPLLKKVSFSKCDRDRDGVLDQGEFAALNNLYWLSYKT